MASQYNIDAISSLTDVEKLRLALAYLHHNDPKNVDWAAAAAHSGAKTKESFKVSFANTMKKLKTTSEKKENGSSAGDGPSGADDSTAVEDTPKKRKRGLAGVSVDEGDSKGADQAPKKRNRSKKAVKKAEAEAKKAREADIEAFVSDTIDRYIKSDQECYDN